MPLRINGTEIHTLYINGVEKKRLIINDKAYFGKKYTFSGSTTGVYISINRKESPYQHASTGSISSGDAIYEGDKIEIYIESQNDYRNAKLYVDLGDGSDEMLRTNTFSFTVVGNVTFRAVAESKILFSGAQHFYSYGSFAVPGLTSDMEILVSATGIFREEIVDYGNTTTKSAYIPVERRELPFYIYDNGGSFYLSRNGNRIEVNFYGYNGAFKGAGTNITPIQLTITEVRIKV